MHRVYLRAIVWLNRRAKSASVWLTRLTGKSNVPIHPKHLITAEADQYWYLDYVEPGMRAVDIGCGNGVHSLRVARRGAMAVGIDASPGRLRTGRHLSLTDGMPTASFLLGDIERPLPFQAGQFDVALLLDVLEHVHRRPEMLREIHRVLRPGGTLLVAAPNRDTTWKRHLRAAGLCYFTDVDHQIEYTWDELQAELRAGGFDPKGEPQPIVYDTPWAGFIDLIGGFSLRLYQRLAQWKRHMARRYPHETIGWHVVCVRVDACTSV